CLMVRLNSIFNPAFAGAFFCYPNFKKIAFFQNLIEKYLLLSRTFLKIAVFCRQWLLELISICSKRAKQQNPSAIAGGVFVLYCLVAQNYPV
ncbi:hypothetical protein, partial [Streptococcus suis]|uniref:hypothetical protein n=1 Tax=Streptococcus suis TaxID=1307 RepID=UPI0005CE421D